MDKDKAEDRLTAELGSGMVELVIDVMRRQRIEQLAMAIAHQRDRERGHEDA